MTDGSPKSPRLAIEIAVCTFRRPQLDDLMRSLASLRVPDDFDLGLIVADNDATPIARPRVEGWRTILPFPVRYVHCPASNISLARNTCLDHATGDVLAFADDDETCSREWLVELVAAWRRTGADVVLGPVRAIYAAGAPKWIRRGDFHSIRPVWVKGEIRTGYTSNALLDRGSPAIASRRFKLELGRSGGEDTEFFGALHRSGGRIAYAPNAWTFEPVAAERATFAWLARRHFRSGQTHGRLLAERSRGLLERARALAGAAAKVAYCLAMSGLTAASTRRRNANLLRCLLHVGAVGGLVGMREITQYGELEHTTP